MVISCAGGDPSYTKQFCSYSSSIFLCLLRPCFARPLLLGNSRDGALSTRSSTSAPAKFMTRARRKRAILHASRRPAARCVHWPHSMMQTAGRKSELSDCGAAAAPTPCFHPIHHRNPILTSSSLRPYRWATQARTQRPFFALITRTARILSRASQRRPVTPEFGSRDAPSHVIAARQLAIQIRPATCRHYRASSHLRKPSKTRPSCNSLRLDSLRVV